MSFTSCPVVHSPTFQHPPHLAAAIKTGILASISPIHHAFRASPFRPAGFLAGWLAGRRLPKRVHSLAPNLSAALSFQLLVDVSVSLALSCLAQFSTPSYLDWVVPHYAHTLAPITHSSQQISQQASPNSGFFPSFLLSDQIDDFLNFDNNLEHINPCVYCSAWKLNYERQLMLCLRWVSPQLLS